MQHAIPIPCKTCELTEVYISCNVKYTYLGIIECRLYAILKRSSKLHLSELVR